MYCSDHLLMTHACMPAQVVHFIRHGEGFHNIGIINEDAHLTEAGWRQAEALNRHISKLKPSIDVQVRWHNTRKNR